MSLRSIESKIGASSSSLVRRPSLSRTPERERVFAETNCSWAAWKRLQLRVAGLVFRGPSPAGKRNGRAVPDLCERPRRRRASGFLSFDCAGAQNPPAQVIRLWYAPDWPLAASRSWVNMMQKGGQRLPSIRATMVPLGDPASHQPWREQAAPQAEFQNAVEGSRHAFQPARAELLQRSFHDRFCA